jgi:phosphopantothenoylcysteine synthetase/decarboxylase
VSKVLYVVACGGHTAAQLEGFIGSLLKDEWDVCAIATPSGRDFMNISRIEALTGHPVRSSYRRPGESDPLPPADAIAVVPATFNTVNKWASGISDTLALGILNEAIGRGIPIVVVPTPNAALAKHPAFLSSIATLRSWGVLVIFDPVEYPPPEPGKGLLASDFFPWVALEQAISTVKGLLNS